VARGLKLRCIKGEVHGGTWDSNTVLRIGRQEGLEISLDDASVSRHHAEFRATEYGWVLQDLGSTNGTYVNGNRLTNSPCAVKALDLIRVGSRATFLVETTDAAVSPARRLTEDSVVVEAVTQKPWEDAVQGLAFDRHHCPRPDDQLQMLIRVSHILGHVQSEKELLTRVLNDAVRTLDAQRGAIVLADGPGGALTLRALATGRGDPSGRTNFSKHLAQETFTRGESILCCRVESNPELLLAQSIRDGEMASILCVLLRTPRRRLGVLHLDRSCWQASFTEDDLHLADALAASVSAGIETAMLLNQQKKLYQESVRALAQAVEMRDDYTGKHTERVTRYSHLIAMALQLTDEEMLLIDNGTPLHDIGKIGIRDAILCKPGRLSEEEFEEMKTHTVKGAKILETVRDLTPVIPIVRSHHERWDGKGYPDGLSRDAIPRLARIVAVADAFDAMTSDRPYRKGMGADAAFEEIKKHHGRQFDPECADAFLTLRDVIEEELRNPADPDATARTRERADIVLTDVGRTAALT
jgi:HD-GYP domain-containing protein (c-di-GMP phosphodiesterase class II)/pSer/pThr/pTyr-binding forkhead associated (FHA) protein